MQNNGLPIVPTGMSKLTHPIWTEAHLQGYFEADQKVRAADQDLVDVRSGVKVDGLGTEAEAAAWSRRVHLWRENLRQALWCDAAPAPGNPACPASTHQVRKDSATFGNIRRFQTQPNIRFAFHG